jgi:hypothetical protein
LARGGGQLYEAEEVKEKDSATREAHAGGPAKTGQAETQIAGGGDGKSVESCEKIGCPSYCISRKQVSGANNQGEENEECQESQAKTESFTGAAGAARSSDEGAMGCKESRRGE